MEPADIRRLLDAFEQSDWNEVRLSVDGVDVVITASDTPVDVPATSVPSAGRDNTRQEDPESRLTDEAPARVVDIPAGIPVCAASPGIFWRAPAPGEPPFVEVGQHVEPDSVVCIVEVMKLMNRVNAGVAGTVAAIVVDNAEQVARDQVLLVVTPDGDNGA